MNDTKPSRKGIIKRGELFRIGKKHGDSVLYLAIYPYPHWSSLSPFIWSGPYTKAVRLLRQMGGGLYSVKGD
jgi:hypothetical protein